MPEDRMKVAPDTVAYADAENRRLVVEFAIPGAPADTVDVKILERALSTQGIDRISTSELLAISS